MIDTPASSRIRCVWVLAGLLLLMAAADASAHAGSMAFWRIGFHGLEVRGQVLVSLDDVVSTAPEIVSASGQVSVERLGAFGEALLAHFVVLEDGAPAAARIVDARVLPSGLCEVQVVHRLTDGRGPVALRATFHELTDETHRVIARVERSGTVDSLVFHVASPHHALRDDRRTWRDAVAPAGSVRAMLLLGAEHILTGYDHLVFLACLLVPGGTWRSRVAIVTAFTAAHSLTLVLAAMKIITPPAHFVEPAIAISIAYVAIENLVAGAPAGSASRTGFWRRSRWPTAFGFGLVHGFGFAGMLDVLELPVGQWLTAVLAFNVGVEIGQLAVVALALPVVVVIARSSWHRSVVQYTSVLVLCLALLWFVERLP